MARILYYETLFFLTALAGLVFYRILTGQINIAGLLRDKINERAISPGRLQLLLGTLAVAIYFISQVSQNHRLPDLPSGYLIALGASHALYLGGKTFALLSGKFTREVPGTSNDKPHGG